MSTKGAILSLRFLRPPHVSVHETFQDPWDLGQPVVNSHPLTLTFRLEGQKGLCIDRQQKLEMGCFKPFFLVKFLGSLTFTHNWPSKCQLLPNSPNDWSRRLSPIPHDVTWHTAALVAVPLQPRVFGTLANLEMVKCDWQGHLLNEANLSNKVGGFNCQQCWKDELHELPVARELIKIHFWDP